MRRRSRRPGSSQRTSYALVLHGGCLCANTWEQEYRDGGRAHWGSEDRRTKMVFVTLDRSLL